MTFEIQQLQPIDVINHPDFKSLLLSADPDWPMVLDYLCTAQLFAIQHQQHWIAQVCVSVVSDTDAEIKNIAVSPKFQGKGYAKCLINHVIEYAEKHLYQRLWIKTGNSSLHQLALYQKTGFRMERIEKNVFINYPKPIYEHGIRCIDQIVLKLDLPTH